MSVINPSMEIEKLLRYALNKNLLEVHDIIPVRNALLDLLQISKPDQYHKIDRGFDTQTEVLNNLVKYAIEKNIILNNNVSRDSFDTKIMGILMPRQSEVIKKFYEIFNKDGAEKATNYFYELSKTSNYIRMDRILRNNHWIVSTEIGDLELNINLSRPSSNINIPQNVNSISESNYPQCLLCIENVGFTGSGAIPPRQNHRIIPIELDGENWYLQYSPYMYYDEHCVLVNGKHIPMKISDKTFIRLIEFVDKFPHYFMGSNSELPIVGGSILCHDHYQGGRHSFPLEFAPPEASFSNSLYDNLKFNIVKWPMSVIRISCRNKDELILGASYILKEWRSYSDEEQEIIAFTYEGKEKIQHNTITPIVRKNTCGEFEIDIILRNNRTSNKHPHGIFHSNENLHHIKSENVGLIEAMGLAVLPGGLNEDLKNINEILIGSKDYKSIYKEPGNSLYKHALWIDDLIAKYGVNCSEDEAMNVLKKEIGYKFLNILIDAGVFKRTNKGKKGFYKFVNHLGFILR